MSLRVFYEVLNQRGTPALFTDTFANRPAFGFQGRLFISTDTAQIFEDTGTAWTLIADAGSGGSFVPYTGALTDVNLGSFDLTADIGIFNQVKAVGSGGLSINANNGGQIAIFGAGGAANLTLYGGLAGTSASFSSSVTVNTIVKSGGTSAEILAANGSVITAGTNITISGGTISSSGGGGGMAIGGTITSATAGSVLFAGASGVLAQDNANFFWDDTNNRLGIGSTTLGSSLQVNGGAAIGFSASTAAPTNGLAVSGATTIGGDATISGVLMTTVTTNRQTASYTLVLADRGKLVEMNVATANNLTIPLNSSVAFPIGTQIDLSQYGAGQTTVVATGGVTIRSTNSWVKLNAQYAAATLIKIGTDEWYLFGNLNA
jgi:hypothetical protein